jgi:hypothetical protein
MRRQKGVYMMNRRNNYRVIPMFNSTTCEEFGEWISAIEAKGYRWEYVHGKTNKIHCLRYWNENGYTEEI